MLCFLRVVLPAHFIRCCRLPPTTLLEAWTYEYLGCFADEDGESEEDRALDRGFSSDSGMTLEVGQ